MATDQKDPEIKQEEQILIHGELRPKNRFYLAVAEQAAKNKASGLPDPFSFPLIEIEGESLSETIIRERGEYY